MWPRPSASAAIDRDNGYFDPRKEAKFERADGGEADRKGPDNPAAEQVDNRAYPALATSTTSARSRRARHFDGKAAQARPRRRSRSAAVRQPRPPRRRAPGRRSGPVTGNVPGEASQFFDHDTQTGPDHAGVRAASPRSRSTPTAASPPRPPARRAGCGSPPPAAASGARTTRSPRTPAWIAPPDDLPTNAFGSLIVDPNDASGNTLYAGSGEPNGSGDSEAGLGLFKSTDGGQSWQLVPGSAAVATNRSIGAIAIRPGQPEHDRDRHRRRPPRLVVGQRRPAHAARTRRRSASTRRPTAARTSRSRPTCRARRRRTRARPRGRAPTGSRAGSRSSQYDPNDAQHAVRRRPRLRRVALDRRRRALDAGLPDDEPGRHCSATAPSSTPSTPAAARPASTSATRPTTSSSRGSSAPTTPRRSPAPPTAATATPAGPSCRARRTAPTASSPTATARTASAATTTSSSARPRSPASRRAREDELWLGGSMNYDELPGVRRPAAALERPRR